MIAFTSATKNDIPLIRELAEKSWNDAYADILSQQQIDYMMLEMYSATELSSHFDNSHYHYFLILYHEKPVGFIGFENQYEPQTTKLHRLYLLPEAKGKGLGKAALNFLKKQVATTSNRRIILNVNKNNPAQHIYLSQGFVIADEVVVDIGNGFVMDDFLMEFTL